MKPITEGRQLPQKRENIKRIKDDRVSFLSNGKTPGPCLLKNKSDHVYIHHKLMLSMYGVYLLHKILKFEVQPLSYSW